MLFVFIFFIFNLFLPTNKVFLYLIAFLLGMLTDYLYFKNLGEGSLIFLFLVFIIFLYQKKIRNNSFIFQICSFVGFSIFFQGIYLNLWDFYKIFWYSGLFLCFVYFKWVIFRK
jgi:rod shape-determining protein MreD